MKTRTRRKSQRTKKTSGRRAALALLLGAALAAGADDKAYGVIIATVFRETGHALPGAELALVAAPEAPGKGKPPKARKGATSMRGEAVFRVPPGPMRYTLTVKAKGYKTLAKTLVMQADERQDVNFLLEVDK
jgi:hypothetical protein